MRAWSAALAIAAIAAVALLSVGGDAEAQAAVTYTAHSIDTSTTELRFGGSLQDASGALRTASALPASEWKVYDITRPGSAVPMSLTDERTVNSVSVTAVGSTPVIRLSHDNINNNPYPIVQYSPGATPALSGPGAAVSTAAVVASPSLTAFTAEVRDGASVHLTFETTGIMERQSHPILCGEGVTTPIATKYLVFFQPRYTNVGPVDYDCSGKNNANLLYPSGWTNDIANQQVTLSFAGERAADLLTSTPAIVFGHRGSTYYHTAAGDMINGTVAIATDNASPVAFASFDDANTIMVEFSEEMARPSSSALGSVAVTDSGGTAVSVSGTPSFTAHTAPTATAAFGRPTLEISLSSPATQGTYTVSFPDFRAAGGPADKRAVAAVDVPLDDTFPPAFTAEVQDGGVVQLTFSEPVRRESSRAVDGGQFYLHTYDTDMALEPGASRMASAAVDPSSVTFTDSSTSMTLTFTGDALARLPTSTPRVGYSHAAGMPVLEDAQDNAMLPAVVTATDNASPVATARFTGSQSIEVTFSEEMALPSDATLRTVAVTAGGQAVAHALPVFAGHTAATASSALVLPTLTINLDSAAPLNTEHTISFGSLRAAGGPSDKRAVADAAATFSDATPPTFVVHKADSTSLILTFSEEVRARAGTTAALDDWEVDATPDTDGDAAVNPTDVVLGHNYADLTIAAVADSVMPEVRYAESVSTIEDLAGNALQVGGTDDAPAFTESSSDPIPLLAAHSLTSTGASQVTVTFSAVVKGTTTAADWTVNGAAPSSVSFTSPSGTLVLSGFTLAPDATPDVAYSGTGLTANIAASPPAVYAREVRATDGVEPTIASARTVSDSELVVTMSEPVRFLMEGTDGATVTATGHWSTLLPDDDGTAVASAVESVAISGRTITLTGDGTWNSAQAPGVRYSQSLNNGAITDMTASNLLASADFTMTVDGAPFGATGAVTSDELLDIMDQRDPADNVHAEYVTVSLSEPARFTISSSAQRAAHWTVHDDEADPPADIMVSSAALDDTGRQVRLTLGSALSSTGATPAVSYSSAMSAGRLVSQGGLVPLASFEGLEARDGIGPRLVAYPESVRLLDGMGMPAAAKARQFDSTLTRIDGDMGAQTVLNTLTAPRLLRFTFSEPIDPASVDDTDTFANISMRLQTASSNVLLGLTGRHPVVLNNGGTGTTWLPNTANLLRTEDSGGAFTVERGGKPLNGLGADGEDNTADDPVTPPSTKYLGEGGNVVTYWQGEDLPSASAPVQNVYGYAINVPPRDLAGNDYRTNRHVNSIHGTVAPDDEGDPAAYDAGTRGIHGTFIVAHDTAAPLFRATATAADTVQAVYMEPVELVAGVRALAAGDWRLDLTPNDDTDNMDSSDDWVTPTGLTTAFSAFERPAHYLFGAPDHTTPTESRLAVTLTFSGLANDLNPNLRSANPDPRPTLHYIGPEAASDRAVEDKYGNRAPQMGSARLVDTTPPTVEASFTTNERTIVVQFSEELATSQADLSFNLLGPGRSLPAHSQSYAAGDAMTGSAMTLSLTSAAADADYTVNIAAVGGALATDVVSPSGSLSPRSWADPGEIGAASSLALPRGNVLETPATVTVPALPAPTFTAETASLTTVDVTFQVGGVDTGLVPKAMGILDRLNWAAELVPAGEDRTERTVTTNDDIEVTGVAAVTALGTTTPITGVTLTLDSNSANIGDTSKQVYVTYTESGESEFQTAQATGSIQRSLLEGTGALAADGVPPGIRAEITSTTTITLTFDEAPASDPTMGIEYSVTVDDDNIMTDSDTDRDVVDLSTTTGPAYTAATSTAPATVVLTTANAIMSSHGDHQVVISAAATSPGSIADASGAALTLPHTLTAAIPAAPTFTAETTSNTEIVLTFDQPVSRSTASTAPVTANWIVDPDGSDGSTDTASDNIAVSSLSFTDTSTPLTLARTLTLTLTDGDANLGDTSKAPYVEYTGSTSEIVNVFGTALAMGASATARDGVAPTATAAFTAEQTVTMTFSEALAADPVASGAGNAFGVYEAGGETNLASSGARTYTAATASTPATLAIPLASYPAGVAHEVRITGTGTINDGATPPNTLDKSEAIAVPAPPAAPTFTAQTINNNQMRVTMSENVAHVSGSSSPMLVASNWTLEVVPAGEDRTERTEATDDDITNFIPSRQNARDISFTFSAANNPAIDASDTSRRIFVTYNAETPEFVTTSSSHIVRSFVSGSALATDGAPPVPRAEITGQREIVLTWPERPTMNPTRGTITYAVCLNTNFGSCTANNIIATTDPTTHTDADATATPPTLATTVVRTASNIGTTLHVVKITATATDPIADAAGASHTSALPSIGARALPPAFTASMASWTELVLTFDKEIELATGVTSLGRGFWTVDPDGAADSDHSDDILVAAVSGVMGGRTVTLTLNSTSANIGDTSKAPYVEYIKTGAAEIQSSLGVALARGTSAVATDDASPQVFRAATGSTGAPGPDPADPADNVYTDHIDVTISEPVVIEAGATAAQRAAHWTVEHDHDGDDMTDAVEIEVTDAAIVLADAADSASRAVRLTLAGTGQFGGTTATPTVSYAPSGYDPVSAAPAGRLVLPGETASIESLVAPTPDAGLEAADGIGPRLVAYPVLGDFTPDTPNDDDRGAFVFSFSEDLDPESVGSASERATMVVARLQLSQGTPTGYTLPHRHDDSACSTGTRWLPASYDVARDSMNMPDLVDIVGGQVDDGMGGTEAGMVRGERANTVRVSAPVVGSDESQRIFWLCFQPATSESAFVRWTRDAALRDTAGNPYVPVERTPHSQFFGAGDARAPEFTATVTGATTVSVFYDEPVRLAEGATLAASEWTVDTTPNDGDSTNAVAATSLSHSFGQMPNPEYWAYGAPAHASPAEAAIADPPVPAPEARLRIDLTFDGVTLDPNQAAPAMDAMDERPLVTYTSSGSSVDVEDVYGNDAASPEGKQARDTIPPEIESINVRVSTAQTADAPVPDRQHARASADSPVAIKFTVTFNEPPKAGTPPILGVFPSPLLTRDTTLPTTSSARETQRIWAMTETAADDGNTWEYEWTVENPLPGETTRRGWDTGFALSYGIVVQDTEGNAAAYTQSVRYPEGSVTAVTLDSLPPEVRATSMEARIGDSAPYTYSTTGKDGSTVELRFTVNERPDRLVHAASGSGASAVYETGLAPSAVTFFSGADEVTATSLTCDGDGAPAASLLACHRSTSGLYTYRATAAIPAGHDEGTDEIEWSIEILDIFGQAASTDHDDIGTTGHVPSLGFRVDNTAPMIEAAMSSVGADRTGGTRMASDALETHVRGGEALLVDVTFDEPILVRPGADPPKVRGYGTVLVFGEDGRAMYVDRQFHAMMPMMPVAGTGSDATGYTRWQHSFTVPDAATLEMHDATYMADILMPTDEAGNSMTFTGYNAGRVVRMDNVAPSVTSMAFVHGEANSRGDPVVWSALEYTEHGGLRTDGLRAYVNSTRLDPNSNGGDIKVAGAGTLLVRVGEFTASQCIAATPRCTAPNGEGRDSFTTFYFQFDYGGMASPTGLTDMAGNAVMWDQPVASPDHNGNRHPQPSAFRTTDAPYFASVDDPIMVTGLPHRDSVSLADVGLVGAGALDFDVTYESPTAPGLSIRLAEGTRASNLGTPPEIMLTERVSVHGLPGEAYYTALQQDDDHMDRMGREPEEARMDVQALRSLASMGARAAVETGRADSEVLLSLPARITIPGAANALHAYWLSDTDTPTQGDDAVNAIAECRRSSADAVDTDEVPGRTEQDPMNPDPTTYSNSDNAECFVREPATGSLHIWTNHFTPFGATTESVRTGGTGCDDCTPPTLGVDSTGVRRVMDGFTYNGASHNVDYYYTPMPLIEVETGVENVAVLKIFEDSGPSRLAHAGLAFGLGRGQHFAESEAEIRVSISHAGELSIALDDPSSAIDAETLRASAERVECMPGSAAVCVAVTIHHTFREPLEFDVVSTNVWDTRRNAWQNFYNHGVHVSGDSLNPSRGIEVNGGEMVLYPLISARVDDNGDGIYDYDERHVTYMLDGEYGVWRLTPDGTYAPLRNLYALHHEIDDAMYADGRIRTHGAERSSALFAEELARQEGIARQIMEEAGIAVPEKEAREAAPSPYDGMAPSEPRLERLSEAIAAEINVAERLMGKISPALAR